MKVTCAETSVTQQQYFRGTCEYDGPRKLQAHAQHFPAYEEAIDLGSYAHAHIHDLSAFKAACRAWRIAPQPGGPQSPSRDEPSFWGLFVRTILFLSVLRRWTIPVDISECTRRSAEESVGRQSQELSQPLHEEYQRGINLETLSSIIGERAPPLSPATVMLSCRRSSSPG